MSKETNDSKQLFITTKDNPFDYFNQFDDWYAFDENNGYHTCEYVARVLRSSDELSEADQRIELENAIDEIIEWNGDLYQKVYKQ